ncbi:autophagic vacuole formation-like protein, putative [Rhizoctonia solani AG-3 Rhs1AP]|uniref:Autophagic vacuole formation-like protein, putative n=2 Tax=Rhizoctonia solani AG-3 TaxID=1086053 RepID=A0A0A1UJW6_9AGAM|nr:autophagic vacuole formation-like protein, putative [Rhizoctonia solani AG-3 Rhs1AP]KEP50443.1 putative autophagic vacuole formation-like protein [Rhizoctonia solani 123E]
MLSLQSDSQAHDESTPNLPSLAVTPQTHPHTALHLVAFFAQYPEFTYYPARPVLNELKRMKRVLKWDSKAWELSGALADFRHALVLQFNLTYGTDQNDLASWQNLCMAMKVTNIPETVGACKKLAATIYVNLVDLVDMPNTGSDARLFKTEEALSKYTRRTKKIFPKRDPDAGGLLKRLLRFIDNPRRRRRTKAKTS